MEKQLKQQFEIKENDSFLQEVNIKEIFSILLSKSVYIIVAALVGALLMFTYTRLFVTPKYSSHITMIVYANPDVLNTDVQNSASYSEISAAVSLANSYKLAIKSNVVISDIRDYVNGEYGYELTNADIIGMTNVSLLEEEAFILKVEVVSTDKVVACNVAHAFFENVKKINERIRVGALDPMDDAQIATAPFSPKTVKNSLIGGVAAAVVAALFFVIRIMSDKTIFSEKDVEEITILPVIGNVPVIEFTDKAKYGSWEIAEGGRMSLDDK